MAPQVAVWILLGLLLGSQIAVGSPSDDNKHNYIKTRLREKVDQLLTSALKESEAIPVIIKRSKDFVTDSVNILVNLQTHADQHSQCIPAGEDRIQSLEQSLLLCSDHIQEIQDVYNNSLVLFDEIQETLKMSIDSLDRCSVEEEEMANQEEKKKKKKSCFDERFNRYTHEYRDASSALSHRVNTSRDQTAELGNGIEECVKRVLETGAALSEALDNYIANCDDETFEARKEL